MDDLGGSMGDVPAPMSLSLDEMRTRDVRGCHKCGVSGTFEDPVPMLWRCYTPREDGWCRMAAQGELWDEWAKRWRSAERAVCRLANIPGQACLYGECGSGKARARLRRGRAVISRRRTPVSVQAGTRPRDMQAAARPDIEQKQENIRSVKDALCR